jgi:membrane-associated phospholipid phosphatase
MRRKTETRNRRGFDVEPLEARTMLSGGIAPDTTSAPLAITARLAPRSDPDGNDVVVHPKAIIEGHTAPGARVQLAQTLNGSFTRTTRADSQGNYRFTVKLPVGRNAFNVVAIESGRSASTALTVSRGNVIIDENATLLDAIRNNASAPSVASRELAMTMVAVYDAVDAVDKIAQPYKIHVNAPRNTSDAAASAAAAETVLASLFPGQTATFTAMLKEDLATVPNGQARANGIRLGDKVGQAIIALRADDGSNAKSTYTPSGLPGTWVPTPPRFAPAVTPQWGSVTPWALSTGSQYLPPPPPAPNSAQYGAELNLTEAIGGTTSTIRTADETAAARFWSDLSGQTFTPAGHWNQVAEDAAMSTNASLASDARTFALLDIALADAAIACWNAKYVYNTARPVTAIRDGDNGVNPAVVADPTWTPLWATPAFPSYMSGHSTFSAAAAVVLSSVFGANFSFIDYGDPAENLAPRTFTSFAQAAEEAGISRIWGGIHFMSDNLAGLQTGSEVGNEVLQTVLLPGK